MDVKRLGRGDIALSLLLIAVSIPVLTFFLRESPLLDDVRYFEAAGQFLEEDDLNNARMLSVSYFRMGIVLNMAFFQTLFGYSSTAYYAMSFMYAGGLLLSMFLLSRLFLPRAAAFSASLLLLTSPMYLPEASINFIDWPILPWFFMGLFFLFCSTTRASTPRWQIIHALLSGLCFAQTFWIKESSIALYLGFPAVFLVIPFTRQSIKLLLIAVGSGVVAISIQEFLLNYLLFEDPLKRLNATYLTQAPERKVRKWVKTGYVSADLNWWDMVMRYPSYYLKLDWWALPFMGAAAFGGLLALVRRNRGMILFLLFSLIGWAFVSLMVVTTDPILPLLTVKNRYLSISSIYYYPLIAFALLTVSGWFSRVITRSKERRRTLTNVLVLLLTCGIAGHQLFHQYADSDFYIVTGKDRFTETGRVIRELYETGESVNRILSDQRTNRAMPMYLPSEWQKKVQPFDQPRGILMREAGDYEQGDVVIINFKRIHTNLGKYYTSEIPKLFYSPPENWELLLQRGNPEKPAYQVFLVR